MTTVAFGLGKPSPGQKQIQTQIPITTFLFRGAPLAQQFKRWPADLEVPGSRSAWPEAGIFSIVSGVPLHTAFHFRPPIVLLC